MSEEYVTACASSETSAILDAIIGEISDVALRQVDQSLVTFAEELRVKCCATDDTEYTVEWAKDKTEFAEIAEALHLLTTNRLKESISAFEQAFGFVSTTADGSNRRSSKGSFARPALCSRVRPVGRTRF